MTNSLIGGSSGTRHCVAMNMIIQNHSFVAWTCVYIVATWWAYVRSVAAVWSYVCIVGTMGTVLLVFLGTDYVLADIRSQLNLIF